MCGISIRHCALNVNLSYCIKWLTCSLIQLPFFHSNRLLCLALPFDYLSFSCIVWFHYWAYISSMWSRMGMVPHDSRSSHILHKCRWRQAATAQITQNGDIFRSITSFANDNYHIHSITFSFFQFVYRIRFNVNLMIDEYYHVIAFLFVAFCFFHRLSQSMLQTSRKKRRTVSKIRLKRANRKWEYFDFILSIYFVLSKKLDFWSVWKRSKVKQN